MIAPPLPLLTYAARGPQGKEPEPSLLRRALGAILEAPAPAAASPQFPAEFESGQTVTALEARPSA